MLKTIELNILITNEGIMIQNNLNKSRKNKKRTLILFELKRNIEKSTEECYLNTKTKAIA